uniref:Metalloprotease TIKI homolog n=1 Tax=Elaeophora elaphi TaxID=1147741 RepID=A0A0R3S0F1_9BILA
MYHLPKSGNKAISEKVKTAFARSDSVVFELDLYNANTIERLSECKNIPGGGTVKDYLSPRLYLRLEHCIYLFYFSPRIFHYQNCSSINALHSQLTVSL